MAALILLCACSNGSRHQTTAPAATVATEPPRTTTTDPYAIPAVIDAAYVNRVLAEFDHIIGEATRIVIQSRALPPPALLRLRSIYASDQRLQLEIDALNEEMRLGFKNFKPNPGDQKTQVQTLISTSPQCIFARVDRDYTAVAAVETPVPRQQWVALVRVDSARNPDGYNRTPWAYQYNGFTRDGSEPSNPCNG